jgi:hypothetical protein
MERFVRSVEIALQSQNWYGALSTALTLPDICGRLSDPTASTKFRYVAWFDKYMLPKYESFIGANRQHHVFLSGRDCYSLRCSILHEGGDSIAEQSARQALDRFHFVSPRPNWTVHCNQSDSVLQLQVDIFCHDICAGVRHWMADVAADTRIGERMGGLLIVHSLENEFAI